MVSLQDPNESHVGKTEALPAVAPLDESKVKREIKHEEMPEVKREEKPDVKPDVKIEKDSSADPSTKHPRKPSSSSPILGAFIELSNALLDVHVKILGLERCDGGDGPYSHGIRGLIIDVRAVGHAVDQLLSTHKNGLRGPLGEMP